MANNVEAGKAEQWASMIQENLYESFVGMKIANTKFEGLFDGADTVHFPRIADLVAKDLASSYDDVAPQDVVETDELFTLSIRKEVSYPISNEDYKEMKVNPDEKLFKSIAQAYAKSYDTEIMKEYANAGLTIDDGDLETASNGGAGNSATLSKTNIYDLLTAINEKLDVANAPVNERFLILTPKEKRLINKSPDIVRSTKLGDKIVTGGYIGELNNIHLYFSNNMQTVTGVKHLLAGQGKPVSFAANIKPNVEITPSQFRNSFTTLVKTQSKFGVKTFTEGAVKLIDVQVTA